MTLCPLQSYVIVSIAKLCHCVHCMCNIIVFIAKLDVIMIIASVMSLCLLQVWHHFVNFKCDVIEFIAKLDVMQVWRPFMNCKAWHHCIHRKCDIIVFIASVHHCVYCKCDIIVLISSVTSLCSLQSNVTLCSLQSDVIVFSAEMLLCSLQSGIIVIIAEWHFCVHCKCDVIVFIARVTSLCLLKSGVIEFTSVLLITLFREANCR
jgi:hypothetical protein